MANEVTLLLNELRAGENKTNRETLDKLLPIVYNELRRLAALVLVQGDAGDRVRRAEEVLDEVLAS